MKILDRLPFVPEHYELDIRGDLLRIRPFQIIIQLSISGIWKWDTGAPIIPALLDTGNYHNFSIQEHQLIRWVGVHPQALPLLGAMREAGRTPSLRFADIWIHRNKPGSRDLRVGAPSLLAQREGIAVYPDDGSNYPRLPLLGLRGIIKNNPKLVIDGKGKCVSLSSPIW
jgi:hypothetical protein